MPLKPRICPQCGGEVIGRPGKIWCKPKCRDIARAARTDREERIQKYAVTRFSNRHLLDKEWDE